MTFTYRLFDTYLHSVTYILGGSIIWHQRLDNNTAKPLRQEKSQSAKKKKKKKKVY